MSQDGLVYDSSVCVFLLDHVTRSEMFDCGVYGMEAGGINLSADCERRICLINCSQSCGPLFAVLHTPGEVTE